MARIKWGVEGGLLSSDTQNPSDWTFQFELGRCDKQYTLKPGQLAALSLTIKLDKINYVYLLKPSFRVGLKDFNDKHLIREI